MPIFIHLRRIKMKTTQQKRADRVKQMEGSQISREYMRHAIETDDGDALMCIQDQADAAFARALLLVLRNRNHTAIDCLDLAFYDMTDRQSSQFPSEEELKENDDE